MSVCLKSYNVENFSTSTLLDSMMTVSPESSDKTTSEAFDDDKTPTLLLANTQPRRKVRIKVAKVMATAPTTTITKRRKGGSKRKLGTSNKHNIPIEETKRKQSLEKNRLAAAKCRQKKAEKTKTLERDAHDKGAENTKLKDQVMRMRTEVQQLNATLVAHAGYDGCKSPEELHAYIVALGRELCEKQINIASHSYEGIQKLGLGTPGSMMEDLSGSVTDSILDTTLPELLLSADLDI
jgi:hypothetical protein